MSLSIMAHESRTPYVGEFIMPHLTDIDSRISLDMGFGEWETGKQALLQHDDSPWHVVLQDDAIIGPNFIDNANEAIASVPDDTIISFYVGTSRPFPTKVTAAVNKAREEGASWLSANDLYWGVGFAIKTEHIAPMLEYVKDSKLPYDQRIGSYFRHIGKKVYYTFPSIVDHLDGKSLIKKTHDYPRKAHEYSDSVFTFNDKVISIV